MNPKKRQRYKIYKLFRDNGKICLINKFSKFSYNYINFYLTSNRNESKFKYDYWFYKYSLENYKKFVNDLFSNAKVRDIVEKELRNEYQRFERCKNRLNKMFQKSDNLFFITFTISNKYYDKYINNYSNFERYVKDVLNSINVSDWCFNLDFGSINERLHCHAVVSSYDDLIDINLLRSLYLIGNVDIKKCYSDNTIAIEKYLTKFTNHSFKDTTLCRVHYKRLLK